MPGKGCSAGRSAGPALRWSNPELMLCYAVLLCNISFTLECKAQCLLHCALQFFYLIIEVKKNERAELLIKVKNCFLNLRV
jgi:hypothetical protein